MSWKKHLVAVPQGAKLQAAINRLHKDMENQSPMGSGSKYLSYLPEVYAGQPNRLERYQQYDSMDKDPAINAAVDTIADFGTLGEEHDDTSFKVKYLGNPTEAESNILCEALNKWSRLNKFKQRMWRMFRSTIMYGDQFFLRDPETFQLFWVNHEKVESITVNEADGKKPQFYNIYDLDLNLQSLAATLPTKNPNRGMSGWAGGGNVGTAKAPGPVTPPSSPLTGGHTGIGVNATSVDATHVIHLSLSEGIDANWPFGNSILESVFKPYKQKELLEDSIIIYRVQRAPERRVFYIDVGNAPTHKAMEFVNRIKNEIHQRRIPSQTGGGTNIMDAAYNPLSIIEDYFFPQTCLSLTTPIPLLDGRTLMLAEIIEEHNQGKVNWVYGLNNKTHELEPAEIKWAGITRKDAKVVKVTLDNDEEIIATPDHRFIARNGEEIEAKDLIIGQSLMPLDLKLGYSGPKQHNKKYMRYRSNATGTIKFVHATISGKLPGKDTEVHHIDFNSFNNMPSNLQVLETKVHRELHKKLGTYSIKMQWDDPLARKKLLDGMKRLYAEADEEFFEKIKDRNRKNGAPTWSKSKSRKKVLKSLAKNREINSARKTVQYSIEMFNRMEELFVCGHNSIPKLQKILRQDNLFQKAYHIANPNILRDKNRPDILLPTDTTLNKLVKLVGFRTFGDWKQAKLGLITKFSSNVQNHKVVSVEFLEERIDTGDITIESNSNSHWFGLGAGIYVHNSEGRGSKVETLPGGENLGEIDDLKYFNNQLLRGLRVPPSYLPFGPDDSSATTYSDGRVGTAYMQEFRFAMYVKRLQNLMNPVFDREFKLFLRHRGIQIDSGLFEVELHEPQSFSKFRQLEIDAAQINTFQPLSEVKYFSKRFLLSRFLNMSEEEINKNQKMWKEENPNRTAPVGDGTFGSGSSAGGLGEVGIRPGPNGEDISDDFDLENTGSEGEESPISGSEAGGPDETGAAPEGGNLEI